MKGDRSSAGTWSETFEAVATGRIRAEPWGDIKNPEAPRQWLPVVGGVRLSRDGAPAFQPTKRAALEAGKAVKARMAALRALEASQNPQLSREKIK